MRRDYIYQDTTGKFKLMQNATRIGGFYAGDQGIVPAEQVLPEQRFAHQPIFRRPPEELVTAFSYINNFNNGVFSSTNSAIKVANLFKKSRTTAPDGVRLLYKYTGWVDAPYLHEILLKNWYGGTTLRNHNYPIFFKNYVFFHVSAFPHAGTIYYGKLNPKKTEIEEVKVALSEGSERFFILGWLYADNTDPDYGYKIVAYRTTNFNTPNESENFIQYKSNSLEGPWVYDKTWDTFSPVYGSPGYTAVIQELASLILSKTHKELSMVVLYGAFGWSWAYNDIRTEAYDPPYTLGSARICSRGDEGEIVEVWEGGPSLKNYLIKRLGNGQMKKTLITDIDNGFFD